MNEQSSTGVGALKDAAERVAKARQCDKSALWYGGAGAGLAVMLLGDNLREGWSYIVILAAAVAAHRIAKVILYRINGLGWLPVFGNALPHTVSRSPAKAAPPSDAPAVPQPRSALVSRLSFSKTWPAAWIVTAKTTGVVTLRGGRPETNRDDLPLGVFMLTERGLAFLPESRDKLEEYLGDVPAAVAMHVAGAMFEPIEVAEAWKDTFELMKDPPTLAGWMETALAQKNAFAISWGDLTGVMVGATHTVLTRRTADGAQDDFIILDASPSWPSILMQRRIVVDLKDFVYMTILMPKHAELLAGVRRELAGKSEDDILTETSRRTMAWFSESKPLSEKAVRDAMAEALEGYSWLPNVVAKQPWLFENKTQENT